MALLDYILNVLIKKVLAISNLKPNDEITFNKNEMADELQRPFVCKCCGKLQQGKKFLSFNNMSAH